MFTIFFIYLTISKVKDNGEESFLNPVRRTFLMQVAQYHLANNETFLMQLQPDILQHIQMVLGPLAEAWCVFFQILKSICQN